MTDGEKNLKIFLEFFLAKAQSNAKLAKEEKNSLSFFPWRS